MLLGTKPMTWSCTILRRPDFVRMVMLVCIQRFAKYRDDLPLVLQARSMGMPRCISCFSDRPSGFAGARGLHPAHHQVIHLGDGEYLTMDAPITDVLYNGFVFRVIHYRVHATQIKIQPALSVKKAGCAMKIRANGIRALRTGRRWGLGNLVLSEGLCFILISRIPPPG